MQICQSEVRLSSNGMTLLSLPVFILVSLTVSAAGAAAKEERSHSLRRQDDHQDDGPEAMFGSMKSFLQDEEEVMDPKSPKAALQRQLVSLIWLERVLERNLNNMDAEAYREKITKSKTALEKDSTPATADMLSNMRTEMTQFNVPFFRDAVQDELMDLQARQKVILDKIMAIDAGETVSVDDETEGAKKEEDEEEEIKAPATPKPEKADKKKKPKPKAKKVEDDPETKKKKDMQSSIFVIIMCGVGGTLSLIVIGIFIKVHNHLAMRAD